jgi:8-oxo-dGTP pyrophosphatase MutT (NUDIX family)
MNEDIGCRLTERMTKSERDQSSPDSEPRDAATLMLIDRAGPTPKVLLGRRHHGHKFMPGKFVFPGGRLEPHDAAMSTISDLHPDIAVKLNTRVAAPSTEFARALALTAIRETAEETGLLLGVTGDQPPATPGEIWNEFGKAKVHPDLRQIHFIARAVTPPRRPKRFDTRFFTADAT